MKSRQETQLLILSSVIICKFVLFVKVGKPWKCKENIFNFILKNLKRDGHAQLIDREAADKAADAAPDPEVRRSEDALDRGCRWHRRLILDEGEDCDEEEGRAERLQRFEQKKPF